MYEIKILLPLSDNEGRRFPGELWTWVRETLVEKFGGLTAFSRSPAEGLWDGGSGERSRDDVVAFEVMDEELDRGWWRGFREELERRFRQEEVVVRAHPIERL